MAYLHTTLENCAEQTLIGLIPSPDGDKAALRPRFPKHRQELMLYRISDNRPWHGDTPPWTQARCITDPVRGRQGRESAVA